VKLREYIVKGFVLDDERLKNPDQPFDYFEELLRRNTRNSTPTASLRPTRWKATLFVSMSQYEPKRSESSASRLDRKRWLEKWPGVC